MAKYVMDAKRYYGKSISDFTLLDPMSGSGTSKFAADNLRIRSVLYDLNPDAPQGRGNWMLCVMKWTIGGFDILSPPYLDDVFRQ